MKTLNTNTRYLHDLLNEYARRVTDTMPEKLDVCFFVNSASEANELAIRLARNATGRRGIVVQEAAYHGNTTSLIDISPYKHDGPGGTAAIRLDFPPPGGPVTPTRLARGPAPSTRWRNPWNPGLSFSIKEIARARAVLFPAWKLSRRDPSSAGKGSVGCIPIIGHAHRAGPDERGEADSRADGSE